MTKEPYSIEDLFALLEQLNFRSGAVNLEKFPPYLLLKDYFGAHLSDVIPENYLNQFNINAYLQNKEGNLHFQKRDLNEPEGH